MRKYIAPPFRTVWKIAKASLSVLWDAPQLLALSLIGISMTALIATPYLTWGLDYVSQYFSSDKIAKSTGHPGHGALAEFYSEFHAIPWPPFLLMLGLLLVWIVASAFVRIFSQVAIISAILSYFRGEKVSFANSFTEAWTLRVPIWKWALLSTGMSLLFFFIHAGVNRLEKIPWLGTYILDKIADWTEIAWNVATFFVVPILIHERISVKEACKQSVTLLKARWKEVAILKIVGMQGIFLLAILPVIFIWFITYVSYFFYYLHHPPSLPENNHLDAILGYGLLVFLVLGILTGFLSSVLSIILRTALYIHATEGIVPTPYSVELMDNAWIVKKPKT